MTTLVTFPDQLMSVRDALEQQRLVDYTIGDRRSNGILNDMLTDDLIAQDVGNGMDIGEAIAKEEFWNNSRTEMPGARFTTAIQPAKTSFRNDKLRTAEGKASPKVEK